VRTQWQICHGSYAAKPCTALLSRSRYQEPGQTAITPGGDTEDHLAIAASASAAIHSICHPLDKPLRVWHPSDVNLSCCPATARLFGISLDILILSSAARAARCYLKTLLEPEAALRSRLASAEALLAAANPGLALALFSLALIFFKAAFSPEVKAAVGGAILFTSQGICRKPC